jgi:hypothetical protein
MSTFDPSELLARLCAARRISDNDRRPLVNDWYSGQTAGEAHYGSGVTEADLAAGAFWVVKVVRDSCRDHDARHVRALRNEGERDSGGAACC